MDSLSVRRHRRLVVLLVFAAVLLAIVSSLAIALRAYLLPMAVGAFAAYACLPVLGWLRRLGVPALAAKLGLFAAFVLVWVVAFIQLQDVLADEGAIPSLKSRLHGELTAGYHDLLGERGWVSSWGRTGRRVQASLDRELRPLLREADGYLRLDAEERRALERRGALAYGHSPAAAEEARALVANEGAPAGTGSQGADAPWLAEAGRLLSLWIVAPILFLFLVYDELLLKRAILRLVPNRYFLLALNVMDEIQTAFAAYLRGIAVQVALVAATLFVLFVLIGMPWRSAMLLALVAGIANIVPFFGPLVGLVLGVAYALVAQDVTPVLPFVSGESLILWVVGSVALTQVLDNTVYQPFVVGGTVALHPLVVILGLLAGSYLFGVVGLLFAVPVIVLAKVFATCLLAQLSAYRLV